jgi:hypothetical protein
MKVRLEVSHNKANVKRIVLERDAIIGRGADCNLRIAANSISRHHCKISITPKDVYVRDLGSSNGTYVEGKKIEPNEDVLVAPGAKLTLGGVKFRVLYDAPVVEAETEDDSELGSTIEFPAVGSAANPVEAEASPADSKIASDPQPEPEETAPAEPVAEEAKVDPQVAAKKAAANAAANAAAAATAAAAAATAAAAQAEETTDEEAVAEAGADLFPTDEVADASEEMIVVDPGAMQQHVDDELVSPEEETGDSLIDTISATPDQLAETTDFVMGNLEAQAQADAATVEDEDVEYEYEYEYEEEEVEEEAPKKKGLLGSVMGMFGRKKAAVEEVEEEVEYEYEEEEVDEAENAAADFLADVGGEAASEATEEDEGLGDFLSDLGGK